MPNLRSSVYGWKSVWMDLADEAKGEFLEDNNVARVRVPMTPWTVTFEMHSKGKNHSKILLPFETKSDFEFEIYNRSWVADAQKKFGLQDIIVGYEDFDRDFIIKGNDESKVKKLYSSETLREMIQLQKAVRLGIHTKGALKQYGQVPAGIHVLAFEEDDAINSFDRLISLLELMRASMTQLCEMGVASTAEPGFQI
ncbi:MAG: hypothetical protein HYX67_05080 [Candidatus Melainabacteria bacterium]|nr:hypothetical protein [Candidatus Melainabacteria bacterium]